MGLSAAGNHHRRRSSMLTGARSSQLGSSERRDDSLRPHGDGPNKWDEQELLAAEDTDTSELSSSALDHRELDVMSSDDDQYDEETGLTARQKRQRRRRRRQRRKLDARIADVKSSRFGLPQLGLADRNVARKLFANAGLILLWYFFSLSISIYNKWMFSESDTVFPFPLFTTSLHMAVQFTLSALLLWIFPSLRPRHPPASASNSPVEGLQESEPVLTKLFYITRLVPCGAATSLDIGLGNMSLKFISLTFLTMCKSSALAFVLLFAFLFRLETPSVKLIIVIATMTIGVVMMVAGETAFNALGFGLVIASAFFSGFRWGLTQILLLRHPATSNPFSTLFLLTPVMFFSLIAIALAVEGPNQIHQGFLNLAEKQGNLFGSCLLVFPGVLAFCMISSEFALLKRSSVVTLSICGIFKEVVTISAAGVVFHDKLTAVNITGLVVTIGSIGAYNYMKISKMRSEAEDDDWSREGSPESDTEDASGGELPEYHRAANPETSLIQASPSGHYNDDLQASPAGDQRRSFRVRASGVMHNLSISTTIPEDDAIETPIKSAPPTITTMADAGFPTHLQPSDWEDSPGVHSSSSISPIRSQTPSQH
ncbi:transporter [Penicillium canariense]|uniref:Transporter n=1 Tax=Penicillium canariense TaxID=189055 RepID=A0A9W9LKL4_9EURO|nr:transporter [Penicillium canariense]KAJ5160788.1 transporter [Penicillium canariense]